jgi:CxxC motif-containing protein (DUF1111 family)
MWRTILAAGGLALVLAGPALAGGPAAPGEDEGRKLFERQFIAERQVGGGDGLGPVFNHVSCASCHLQGGLGGAGPVDVNAVILSATLGGPRPDRATLFRILRETHPGFVSADGKIIPNVLLHRFGSEPGYAEFLRNLADGPPVPLNPGLVERDELVRKLAEQPLPTGKMIHPLKLTMSHRNTTALFGAGQIDQVPDSVLHLLADSQRKAGVVSGRVPPIGPDRVGRFGWRGQTEHLHDFVIGACANELGLEVPGAEQPQNPLQPKYRPIGLDLTAEQCNSLTAFVAALPTPQLALPDEPGRRDVVGRGQAVFESVGCANCHVARIGPLDGLYSDLLLHDMGPALADPLLAAAELKQIRQTPLELGDNVLLSGGQSAVSSQQRPPRIQPPRGYYGESSLSSFALLGDDVPEAISIIDEKAGVKREFQAVLSPLDREWRTPPLWGLADSAPYLHDGRAATVIEAIALHGGEADACTKRYFALPAGDRIAMLEFLSCLKAPTPD